MKHIENFVEVSGGPKTRFAMDMGRSLHYGIQEGNTMASNQQSFVCLDVTEYIVMQMENSGLKKGNSNFATHSGL